MMHFFIVTMAACVGWLIAVILTIGIMAFISSRKNNQSYDNVGGDFIVAIMLALITGPIGAIILAYVVHHYA